MALRLLLASLGSLALSCAGSGRPDAGVDGGEADASGRDAAVDAGVDAGAPPVVRAPWLRDSRGGVLILRGTNVEGASKTAEDHLPRQGAEELARLHDELGLDAIRLLVFWEAIEPDPGAYDDAYLSAVRDLAVQAGEAGLHVLVDMHQDVYGEGFGFAGAPAWTCDAELYASFDPPGEWFLGYFEPEVMECFDRLYADPALRASFAAAWGRLAQELRDVEAVLAYELLNEPSWGSGSPRRFDREIAPDFYAQLIDAIRARDPATPIAIEPAASANIGLRTDLIPPEREGLIYAPHYYPVGVERDGVYDGDVDGLRAHLGRLVADAARLELPLAITELGVTPDAVGAAQYVSDLYALLDEAMVGAFQWEIRGGYDLVDDTFAPTVVGRALVRPYPARVAGIPIEFAWDAPAGEFRFEWDEDGSAAGDTIVMVPSLVFALGFDATVDDGGEIREERGRLRIPQQGGRRRLHVVAR